MPEPRAAVDVGAAGLRRVLIVAYYFPPLGGIGSMRTSRFAQDLEDYGWHATVLAPRSGSYHRDPELTFAEERVVRTGSLEISRVAKHALHTGGDDITPAAPGPLVAGLRKLARSCVYFPDAQIGWYAPALITGRRTLRAGRFDLIFSTAYPMTAHLVARRLRRAAKLPWVAEYRDPFSDLVHPTGFNWRRADRLERAIASEADEIVMTAPTWALTYGQRWGRDIEVITNGCDTAAARAAAPQAFVLSHLGSMFPERQRLDGLWRALETLTKTGEAPRLKFIGRLRSEVRAELDAHGLSPIVDESGFIPHDQAVAAIMASTAVLLCGQADDSLLLKGWIPAKTFEYLATDVPILYVGNPGSDVATILRAYPGCHVVAPDDTESIISALRATRGQRFPRDISELTRHTLAGRLARTFDRVVSSKKRDGVLAEV